VYRLCVIGLVVLSGCAGVGVDGVDRDPPSETVTPAPVPDADRETLRTSGIDDGGVSDPGALAEAHSAWLSNRSYTLVSNQTVRYRNGSVRSQYRMHLRLAANRTYLVTIRTDGPEGARWLGEPPAVAKFWSDGELFLRSFSDPVAEYSRFRPAESAGTWRFWTATGAFSVLMTPAELIERGFEAVPTRIDERGADGGISRYWVTSAEPVDSDLPFEEADPARDLTLVAEVDGTGLVRHLELEYRSRIDGEPVVVTRRISYTDVGETAVGRPEWSDEST
jgi:hypothetical protein